jgi:FdhE protein
MNLFQGVRGQYDDRIHRAQYLASEYSFATEVLNFYRAIAQFQKSLYQRIAAETRATPAAAGNAAPPPIRKNFDAAIVLPQFRAFLEVVARNAPAPLAASAEQFAAQPAANWIALLSTYWTGRDESLHAHPAESSAPHPGANTITQFFPRAFLQPYAEVLAEALPTPQLLSTTTLCPLCASAPLLGVLRREGDSGKRFLLCSFCSQEWEFRRILCATCGESAETKQPVYVAEQFPHIRVEACDTCHHYLRTIDLTTDGHAVPLVDDLAALPLSLWAHQHNYYRPQPNLLDT